MIIIVVFSVNKICHYVCKMREDEGTFKSQAAEAKGSNCDNSKSLQR
jgi:hypothetical protein